MATGKEEAKFSLNFETNAKEVAGGAADSLDALRSSIVTSEQKVKDYNSSLRRLRGNTKEIADAKDELNKKITAEKDKISQSNLTLIKAGTSYQSLADKAKALATRQKEMGRATSSSSAQIGASLSSVGGPASALSGKFETLRTVFSSTAAASVALVGSLAALTAGLVAGGVALAKWILESGNMLRTQQLTREAMLGSAEQARNLGTQVEALSGKVSTSRETLNQMAADLSRTRLSGNALVDTLHAMGQANGAGLDGLSSKLKEITTRGQLWGRMQLNPFELIGSGLEFEDVAQSLGESMKGGVAAARAALFEGRVKLDDGAKAIRKAVEKRFGDINLRKMLDLNVMAEKFRERLASLTSDVKLEPMLKAISSIADMFSESTVTGAALKDLLTSFGNAAAKGIEKAVPYFKKFFQGMIIGGLELEVGYFKVRNALRSTFGDSTVLSGLLTLENAVRAGKLAVYGFAAGIAVVTGSLATLAAFFALPTIALVKFAQICMRLPDDLRNIWASLKSLGSSAVQWGRDVVDGLIKGIRERVEAAKGAVRDLATSIKSTFTGSKGIDAHSPSRKFEQAAENIPTGVASGVVKATPQARSAIAEMVGTVAEPVGGGGARASLQRGPISVSVVIHAGQGGAPSGVTSPAFLEHLTKHLEDALVGAGVAA